MAGIAPVAPAAGWTSALDVQTTWNDNLTNANQAADEIAALSTSVDASVSRRLGLPRNNAIIVTGHVANDWTPRFDDLRQHALGGRAEWQHKFGLGPYAPTLGFELSVDGILAADRDREGTALGGRLTFRRRFDDLWRATVAQDVAHHEARAAVFDWQSRETSLAVDRPLGDAWHLTVRASYRDGDIVAYGTPPRPDLVALAPNRIPTLTFGRAMVAYSIDASSITGAATLARALGGNSSLALSYAHRETRRSPLVYVNNLWSVDFAYRF